MIQMQAVYEPVFSRFLLHLYRWDCALVNYLRFLPDLCSKARPKSYFLYKTLFISLFFYLPFFLKIKLMRDHLCSKEHAINLTWLLLSSSEYVRTTQIKKQNYYNVICSGIDRCKAIWQKRDKVIYSVKVNEISYNNNYKKNKNSKHAWYLL